MLTLYSKVRLFIEEKETRTTFTAIILVMGIKQKLSQVFSQQNRKNTEKYWLLICLAYSVLRSIVVYIIFGKNGVNPIWYFFCDFVSSIFFSLASFRFVTSLIDKKHRNEFVYGLLSSLAFFAPDLFILMTGEGISKTAILLFCIYLIITVGITGYSIYKDYRNKRKN